MQDMNALDPAELKRFRRRYNQARLAIGVVGSVVILLFFSLSLSIPGWMAVCFGVGIVCFLLELRAPSLPRLVLWSGGPTDPNASCPETPGITILRGPPTRCRGSSSIARATGTA